MATSVSPPLPPLLNNVMAFCFLIVFGGVKRIGKSLALPSETGRYF
jgi:hypothetical protein